MAETRNGCKQNCKKIEARKINVREEIMLDSLQRKEPKTRETTVWEK